MDQTDVGYVNEPTILMKQQSGNLIYALYANSGDGTPNAWYVSNGNWVNVFADSGDSAPLNTWTHIAATFDGATLRIFHNGQLSASQASLARSMSRQACCASAATASGGTRISGLIDEVRIYDRALSATEIAEDMATPVAGGGQFGRWKENKKAPHDADGSDAVGDVRGVVTLRCFSYPIPPSPPLPLALQGQGGFLARAGASPRLPRPICL